MITDTIGFSRMEFQFRPILLEKELEAEIETPRG